MKYNIKTEGMGCEHCIKRVTAAMEGIGAGAMRIELNDITVEFSGAEESIRNAIEDLGFDVISVEKVD